jgi:hypothetical protein
MLVGAAVDDDAYVSSLVGCALAGIIFLGSWTGIVMRWEVFPQVCVGELEAEVL